MIHKWESSYTHISSERMAKIFNVKFKISEGFSSCVCINILLKCIESNEDSGRDGTDTWPQCSIRLDIRSRILKKKELINGTKIRVKELVIYQKRVGQMNESSLLIAILFRLRDAFYSSFVVYFLWPTCMLYQLVHTCSLWLLYAASTELSHNLEIFVSFWWE